MSQPSSSSRTLPSPGQRLLYTFAVYAAIGAGVKVGSSLAAYAMDWLTTKKKKTDPSRGTNSTYTSSSTSTSTSSSSSSSTEVISSSTNTVCARSLSVHPSALTGLSVPCVTAVTYKFDSAQRAVDLSGRSTEKVDEHGFIYARWANPTTWAAMKLIEALEGVPQLVDSHQDQQEAICHSILYSSGMGAISSVLTTILKSGDHVILPRALYGGTFEFVQHVLVGKLGVTATFVDATDINNYKNALLPNTKVVYAETPCNPTMRLTDLFQLGTLVQQHNQTYHANFKDEEKASLPTVLIVDGTFGTPYHQQALHIPGVGVSIHSATKYLGGHSDLTAGTATVHPSYAKSLLKPLAYFQKLTGNTLSPRDAEQLIKGLKSFSVRMERHNFNSLQLAQYLNKHPFIETVHHPLLPSHPDHQLCLKQMKHGSGGMLAFELKGGMEAGKLLVENVKLINHAVSLGGAESLICHAASTTHYKVPAEQRVKSGITDGLIRLSVGLEDSKDLIADLEQALGVVQAKLSL